MSIRLEMLQVARLAPNLLGDSTALVENFIRSQEDSGGGFRDRAGKADLYYSVFGIDALNALRKPVEKEVTTQFLKSFGNGSELDLVHLGCLVRCWRSLDGAGDEKIISPLEKDIVSKNLEQFRAEDGGYNIFAGSPFGTVYGAFVALAAHQDLGGPSPEPMRVVQSLKFLETPDGGWSNDRLIRVGSTNATAAAITVLRHLRLPIHDRVGEWLLQQAHPDGGFRAVPDAPIPDLLSTATALHALSGLGIDFSKVRERCLDFIDTLWTNQGGFHGHWADDQLDCEYTFYGLLALGHLSL